MNNEDDIIMDTEPCITNIDEFVYETCEHVEDIY